jgi:AraC-like DNA-binding protein
MVKNGQAGRLVSAQSFLGVGYKNLRFPTLGIESLRLSELLSRMPPHHFSRPQRPGFHLLLLFTSGSGDHFLDFRRVSCRPGTLIHARPGQVQQFVLGQTLEADVLLFTPEFLLPAIVDAGGREVGTSIDDVVPDGVAQLEPDALEAMESVIAAISRAYKKTNGLNISAAILRHLLYATLYTAASYCLKADAAPVMDGYGRTVKKFLMAVERRYKQTRTVEEYAHAIGCSVKSLRRACMMASGSSPKILIEQRLILEAKRLLVHTNSSVQAIAISMGFSEPTNFVKFFRRHGGMSPLEFRVKYPGARASEAPRISHSNGKKPSKSV